MCLLWSLGCDDIYTLWLGWVYVCRSVCERWASLVMLEAEHRTQTPLLYKLSRQQKLISNMHCLVLVSRGGWCQVTVSFRLPSLKPPPSSCGGRSRRWRGANVLWSSCVMRPVISCRICSDARNVGFPRYNTIWYDSIRYTQYRLRYDTDPIIVCSPLCTWLKSGLIKTEPEPQFLFLKNRPKPTANPKMETVTALALCTYKAVTKMSETNTCTPSTCSNVDVQEG